MASLRIGIDFGGTKFEIIALDQSGAVSMRRRVPNPGHYDGAIRTLVELVHVTERELGGTSSVGVQERQLHLAQWPAIRSRPR